ncbi:MAG: hypothetical protein ABI232_08925, partial [Jatrophihabitantaceae bacterium]
MSEPGACPTLRLPLSAARASTDASNLQASLGDLATLETGSLGFPEFLERVAIFAAHAIPGADGAGVTVLQANQSEHR